MDPSIYSSVRNLAGEEPGLGRLLRNYDKPATRPEPGASFSKSSAAQVAISPTGSRLGQLGALVEGLADERVRHAGHAGLRALVAELGANPAKLLDVSVELNATHSRSPDAFRAFLGAAAAAGASDLEVKGFAESFVAVERLGGNRELGSRLAEEVRQIATLEGYPDQRERTLDHLLDRVDAVLAGDRESRSASLETLFEELAWEDVLADKDAYLSS